MPVKEAAWPQLFPHQRRVQQWSALTRRFSICIEVAKEVPASEVQEAGNIGNVVFLVNLFLLLFFVFLMILCLRFRLHHGLPLHLVLLLVMFHLLATFLLVRFVCPAGVSPALCGPRHFARRR